MFYEQQKRVEFLCRKVQGDAVGEQSFLPRIENELPKLIDKPLVLSRFHRVIKKERKSQKKSKTFRRRANDDDPERKNRCETCDSIGLNNFSFIPFPEQGISYEAANGDHF